MIVFHPVLHYYPSQAGGPANSIFWLNESLEKNQIETMVLSSNIGVDLRNSQKFIDLSNVKYIDYKFISFCYHSLIRIIKSDIIQLSSIFFPPTLPILFFSVLLNKKIILSPRGELYDEAIKNKRLKKLIWLNILKFFQKKINFVATNHFEKKIIISYFSSSKSISVIPNYMILPKKIKSKVEEKIIFLGRINPIKNIIILLESFNKLCELQKFNKLKLLIVGSARLDYEISYLKKLKNFVKMNKLGNRVIFKGSLYGIDKFKEIASSKILILPSKSENFGNVVTESLSQGTPVVASSNTPWSILNDYKAGCWIDSEINSKVLSDEILKILELNKKEFNNLRKQALNLCKKEFDINLKIHEWINLYKSL